MSGRPSFLRARAASEIIKLCKLMEKGGEIGAERGKMASLRLPPSFLARSPLTLALDLQ